MEIKTMFWMEVKRPKKAPSLFTKDLEMEMLRCANANLVCYEYLVNINYKLYLVNM